ncbi:MAG: hypothetical protein V4702_04240 [Patescibacteria group bacterium]
MSEPCKRQTIEGRRPLGGLRAVIIAIGLIAAACSQESSDGCKSVSKKIGLENTQELEVNITNLREYKGGNVPHLLLHRQDNELLIGESDSAEDALVSMKLWDQGYTELNLDAGSKLSIALDYSREDDSMVVDVKKICPPVPLHK